MSPISALKICQLARSCFPGHIEHRPQVCWSSYLQHLCGWKQTGCWAGSFIWLSVSYWTDIAHNNSFMNSIQNFFDAFQKLQEIFLNSHNEADTQEPCVSSQQGAIALLWEADVLSQYVSLVSPTTKCFSWDGFIFLFEEGNLLLDRIDASVFPRYNSILKVYRRLPWINI